MTHSLDWAFIVAILFNYLWELAQARLDVGLESYNAAVLSLLWGWVLDGNKPDSLDLIGGTVSLVGVAIIMYAPR